MYQVLLLKSAIKDLKKLDRQKHQKVISVLRQLEKDPYVGIKMKGVFSGWFRIKIPPLRIIYTLESNKKRIFIRAIGFRGDVYK